MNIWRPLIAKQIDNDSDLYIMLVFKLFRKRKLEMIQDVYCVGVMLTSPINPVYLLKSIFENVFLKQYFWKCIFESVFLKVYFQDVYCVGILGRAPETQSKQRSETATDTLSFPGRVELSKIGNLLFQRDGEYIFFSVRKRRVHVESPRGINWLAAPSLTNSHKYTNTNTKYTLNAPEV